MNGKELFDKHAAEWTTARGFSPGTDPLESAVSRGKFQILQDVQAGDVPPEVASFSELHDFVDANYYGDGFDWPVLSSDTDDEGYQIAFMNFWNDVQDRLNDWIVSGEMRKSLTTGAR